MPNSSPKPHSLCDQSRLSHQLPGGPGGWRGSTAAPEGDSVQSGRSRAKPQQGRRPAQASLPGPPAQNSRNSQRPAGTSSAAADNSISRKKTSKLCTRLKGPPFDDCHWAALWHLVPQITLNWVGSGTQPQEQCAVIAHPGTNPVPENREGARQYRPRLVSPWSPWGPLALGQGPPFQSTRRKKGLDRRQVRP